MKKVLVTGGAGFIGSNLVDRLIEMGISVTVIDDLSTGKKENINPKAEFYECSLVDLNDVNSKTIFSDVDVVFHLAALARVQPSIEDPINFNKITTIENGIQKTLDWYKKFNNKNILYFNKVKYK